MAAVRAHPDIAVIPLTNRPVLSGRVAQCQRPAGDPSIRSQHDDVGMAVGAVGQSQYRRPCGSEVDRLDGRRRHSIGEAGRADELLGEVRERCRGRQVGLAAPHQVLRTCVGQKREGIRVRMVHGRRTQVPDVLGSEAVVPPRQPGATRIDRLDTAEVVAAQQCRDGERSGTSSHDDGATCAGHVSQRGCACGGRAGQGDAPVRRPK